MWCVLVVPSPHREDKPEVEILHTLRRLQRLRLVTYCSPTGIDPSLLPEAGGHSSRRGASVLLLSDTICALRALISLRRAKEQAPINY